jgi:hypothetical protein
VLAVGAIILMTGIKKTHGDLGVAVDAGMPTQSQNPHPVA